MNARELADSGCVWPQTEGKMKNGAVWNAATAVESLGCMRILQKYPLNTE